jgi:hypothetical protein
MFLPSIFRKNILGIDFNIEFDFWESIFRTWQYIYERRLFYVWSHKLSFDTKSYQYFVKYALTHLPNGSFIIFFFDSVKNIAVQFMRSGEDIYLVIPVWENNPYEGMEEELSKLEIKSKIIKSSISRKRYGKGRIDVSICFHKSYTKAAGFALSIAKDIFHYDNPRLFEYDTTRLVPKLKS